MASSGCRVPEPKPQALADFQSGFSTPEGTLESLRTAFQAEVLDWEWSCFSEGFRRRIGGRMAYRAFRPDLMEEVPLLRWALYVAKIHDRQDLPDGRVRLVLKVPVPILADRWLELILVQEELVELRAEDLVRGEALDLAKYLQVDSNGTIWLALRQPTYDPSSVLTEEVLRELLATSPLQVTGGRYWKIDDLGPIEKPED